MPQAAPSSPHQGGLRGLRHVLAWLARRRLRYRIQGPSMGATLPDGTEVLIDPRAYRRRPPAPGDVVLVEHPYRPGTRIVKRIERLTPEGNLVLAGDAPESSTDSRSFGAVLPERVVGRVVWVFPV